MKRTVPILMIAVGALALLVWFVVNSLLDPALVRDRRDQVQRDLRSLHTAVNDYMDEHGAPPNDLTQLTTPTAHLAQVPEDPFGGRTGHDVTYETDGLRWRVYSQGPDRDDDGGAILYDVTNGSISDGDIVRVGPTPDLWANEIPGIEGQGFLSVPLGTRVPTH